MQEPGNPPARCNSTSCPQNQKNGHCPTKGIPPQPTSAVNTSKCNCGDFESTNVAYLVPSCTGDCLGESSASAVSGMQVPEGTHLILGEKVEQPHQRPVCPASPELKTYEDALYSLIRSRMLQEQAVRQKAPRTGKGAQERGCTQCMQPPTRKRNMSELEEFL